MLVGSFSPLLLHQIRDKINLFWIPGSSFSVGLIFLSGRQQLLHGLGRYPEAQQAGRPWIDWARKASDLPEEARAHNNVGRSFGAQDNHPQAAEHFQAALEAVRPTDDRELELRILLGLSFSRTSMAQYREAQTLL